MLDAWFASDVAQQCAACGHLVPEAPFFLQLGESKGAPLFVNGFIDLLAYDADVPSGQALAVDYKTGKSLVTSEARRAAYEVQAQTYAYALLQQGFEQVALQFVFVEQNEGGELPVETFPAPGEFYSSADDLRDALLAHLSQASLS